MSRGTAYYDLPNGERIELPTTMPDVEEVPGPLCDGKFELPEAVKEMFKWMDETFGTWESDFSSFKIWMKLRKNFNPPVRWEAVQDKRRNPKPLGRNTYLYRIVNAQWWGIPQRRRRVYAVCDTRRESAGVVVFERKGTEWNFEPCIPQGEEVTGLTADCYSWHDRMVATKPCGGAAGSLHNEDPQRM